jgi:hypothetical protein
VIITVTSADKRKMILWLSLHIEVNRDAGGQPAPSATMINTSCCLALDDQQRVPPREVVAIYDHLRESCWAGFPRGRSTKVDRCRRPGCLAEGSGNHRPAAASRARILMEC